MKSFSLNIPISKVDEEQRIVYGYATVEELDRQGDIVDYEASKKAFSKWAGNIREQHDAKRAVGKNVHMEFDDDGKRVLIGAKISRSNDGENAWTKVQEGILTGFSIGGKIYKTIRESLKADDGEEVSANRITDYDLAEVSLVDVPACPSAQFVMVKSLDGHVQEVEEMHEDITEPWFMKSFAFSPTQLNQQHDLSDTTNMSKQSKGTTMSNEESIKKTDDASQVDAPLAPQSDAPLDASQASEGSQDAASSEETVEKANVAGGEERDANAEVVSSEASVESKPIKVEVPEKKKGLYTVAQLGDCIENLNWICSDAEFEAQYEGDGSQVPGKLRDLVNQLLGVYQQMAQEEAQEAVQGDDVEVVAAPVELADKPADLQKMVAHEIETTKADLLKSVTEAIGDKVAEVIKPLEDRLANVESQPAAGAPKREYSVVDKADKAPVESEASNLLAKADDMAANPQKYSQDERNAIVSELFKLQSRQRPIGE